jgi:cysteine desulfurase
VAKQDECKEKVLQDRRAIENDAGGLISDSAIKGNTMKTLYFDYSATTPVDPRVAAKMIPYLTEHFGNPASRSHPYGWEAEKAVEEARARSPRWSAPIRRKSCSPPAPPNRTTSPSRARGHFYSGTKGKHIITVRTEHKAVLDTVREMERQGFEATYLNVKENGLLDLDDFRAAIRPDTVLVSVMAVNNEIGVIQDIEAIGKICREKGVIFHVDAAQATGKMPIDLRPSCRST